MSTFARHDVVDLAVEQLFVIDVIDDKSDSPNVRCL